MPRVIPSFICFKEKKKATQPCAPPLGRWLRRALAGLGEGERGREGKGGGRRPGQAGGTLPGNHSFPGVSGAGHPHIFPGLAPPPLKTLRTWGYLGHPLRVAQAPLRNAVARPGQEPHQASSGFPKTKAGSPRPAWCPGPSPRPLGA